MDKTVLCLVNARMVQHAVQLMEHVHVLLGMLVLPVKKVCTSCYIHVTDVLNFRLNLYRESSYFER